MGLLTYSTVTLAVFYTAMATGKAPNLKLNDGNEMPSFGLGTYGTATDVAKMRQTIVQAIKNGYRHIDTAALYDNERQIGQGIADAIQHGFVKREDLFVTTKLWNDKHHRNDVEPALRKSLALLRLDYVDLYLIHSPDSQMADGSPDNVDYLETWEAMVAVQRANLTKSIGVSNFGVEQIDRLIYNSKVKPAVNQIEVHPTLTQQKLVSHCQDLGITVVAYSPLGFLVSRRRPHTPPPRADDPTLSTIAHKYRKTTTQVVLRYLIDRGIVPIPKSTNEDRLKQNLDVFDFKLTPDEVMSIDKFNKNISIFDDVSD